MADSDINKFILMGESNIQFTKRVLYSIKNLSKAYKDIEKPGGEERYEEARRAHEELLMLYGIYAKLWKNMVEP